jgi:hypothetical protein
MYIFKWHVEAPSDAVKASDNFMKIQLSTYSSTTFSSLPSSRAAASATATFIASPVPCVRDES